MFVIYSHTFGKTGSLHFDDHHICSLEAASVENSFYKLTLNENGDITSLFDKRNNKELVKAGKAIRLALFTENKSFEWPAWEILKETVDATPI